MVICNSKIKRVAYFDAGALVKSGGETDLPVSANVQDFG